jgi:hypothetical protein
MTVMSAIPADADFLNILERGRLDVEGLVAWGSNYTFLVQVCSDSQDVAAIYKPGRGERPLWDFPRGTLCLRERAAFLVSEILGWQLVPPTVLREGPHGTGSLQLFVEHDPQRHYLTFQGSFAEQTRQIALFDVFINNADRKSGHVLLGEDGRLWAIDHGVCFHSNYKLRTVIWEFAGEPIPTGLLADLRTFRDRLVGDQDAACIELRRLLSGPEIEALVLRLDKTIKDGVFPQPGPGRHYPWPLV